MVENKYYVYRHYIGNNTFYVGKGSGDRAYETRKNRRNIKWCEFVNNREYNVEIVKYFNDNKKALDFEEELTQYYKNIGQCEANISIGAKINNETKTKMSKAHLGKVFSEEHKIKISQANFGKTHTKEAKEKMSNNHSRVWLGKTHTKETKEKISKAHIGKTLSDEQKIKISKSVSKAISGGNNPLAKHITVSINGIEHTANCKRDMQDILLDKYNINAHKQFLLGKIPKKHRNIIDYIKVEDKIIYKKGEI